MISKTSYKNYARCPRYFSLELIEKRQTDAIVNAQDDEVREMMQSMFSDGENLLDVSNEQLEAMMLYFNKLEEISAKIVGEYFDGEITYSLKTKSQKSYDCWGENYQYICYVDIYLDKGQTFNILEVKATTTNKFTSLKYKENKETFHLFEKVNNTYILQEELDQNYDISNKYKNQRRKLFNKYSDTGKYVYDLAVQRWIIEHHHLQNKTEHLLVNAKYYLVVLNGEYIFDGKTEIGDYPKIDNQEIACFIDLTAVTKEYQSMIDLEVLEVEKHLDERELSEGSYNLGIHCQKKKTTECKYSSICWDILPKANSLLTYIDNHHGFKDSNDTKHLPIDLINSGKVKMNDIPISWLHREKNQIQRTVLNTGITYKNNKKITDGLSVLKFPIYHLDFESFPCPLPRYHGEKPYTQSVFQYSLHVQEGYKDC